jgi:hypothetical protein
MRADLSEHLDRMITSLPIWPLAEVRVTPLIVWTFNILGSADLLHAFYEANRIGLDPGLQGAAYFIPILLVPLLLITHGLVFVLLLRKDTAAMSPVRHRAA